LKQNNLLTDHQLSALDIENNIALTANAGSGKTFVLSKRYLEIAVTTNIPLRKIAAITFTEKAASELYKKIATQVEETLASSTDALLNEKLYRIRRSLVSANISTIHSFCINLLKEYPVEAQLDANFRPIDTAASSELIELAVDSVLRAALNSPEDSSRIKSLIRLFSSRIKFSSELHNLISNRKNVLELKKKIYSRDAEEIAALLYNIFLETADNYLKTNLPPFLDALKNMMDKIASADPSNKIAVDANACLGLLKKEKSTERLLKVLGETSKVVCTDKFLIRKLLIKKVADEVTDEAEIIEKFIADIQYFCIDENHLEAEKVLAQTGIDIIYFFDKALKIYEEKKQARGYVDFEDILLFTKKLLEDESLRESIWQKYEYIMIDEYQDTNELQYEIFLPILDYLKRGNLFVVGDEKQSIYMFRDAELEVFDKTKEEIKLNDGGKLLVLPDSFRMSPDICLFTNYVFRKLFSDPNLMFNEVNHSDLVCARKNSNGGEIAFLIEDEDQSEAELIALKILELRKTKDIKWNDAAVLSRKRKSFDELEESFVKYNIPYLIMGGRNFYQRQSIYDIHNYFSFLLDNNNDAALAGILRSPFFNLSDSKLYEISLSRGLNFYEKLLNTEDETLCPVKEKLKTISSAAAYSDAPALLRMMLDQSDFIAYLSSKKNGQQETANINKLIKVTINFYSQGFRTLYDYVYFLRNNIEQTEDESQAVIADDSNTVKIMTIHQAKGLEYPVVFLFKAGETAVKGSVKQKSLKVNKHLGILTKVPLNENYYEDYHSLPVVELSNFITLKKDNAELKRLLYVGITRAKDYLYISACREENYSGDSFMGLLSGAFADDFSFSGFCITDDITFLERNEDKYQRYSSSITLNIPVYTSINAYPNTDQIITQDKRVLLTDRINDSVKDEIISATRFSTFNKCPLKYRLTYIDGLLPVIKPPVYGSINDEEKDEEVTAGTGSIKGRVIHSILQKEKEELNPEVITSLIMKEEPLLGSKTAAGLALEIRSDLEKYYNSSSYKLIRDKKSLNEYEVYFREKDYILYGIIDKLIIDENTAYIIDYKTDDIKETEIAQRASEYFNQLKFYSYIIWNAFNYSLNIFYKIIFIKYPERCFEKEETIEDLQNTGVKITKMIISTRNNQFDPEKNHCSKCIYSPDHINCIIRKF
jgi:ATP-dependent helicase/nuclease subunit A